MENTEIESADKDTQSIEETEIELGPFNIIVPLGYGLVAPSIGRLSEDINSFGGKKDDLVLSYYLMKEKLFIFSYSDKIEAADISPIPGIVNILGLSSLIIVDICLSIGSINALKFSIRVI